jgi:hypothetical protein
MKRRSTVSLALLAFVIWPTWVMAQDVLPRPGEPFKGPMTRKAKDSRRSFSWARFSQILDSVHIERPRIAEMRRRRVFA